jgi:membrane fusion protein (multidrug efflux system)
MLRIELLQLRVALCLLVFVLGGSLAACSGGPSAEGEESEEEAAAPPVPVEVAAVVRRDLRRTVLGTTTLESAQQVSVQSEVAGTARSVNVMAGDTVAVGDILARVVNEENALSLAEARQSLDRLERELESLTPLFEQGYLARRTYDETVFQRDSARTNLRRVQQQGGNQRVRAPAAGVVVRREVEEGEQVVPNQLLFEIANVDELEAAIAVPERELVALRDGQAAEVGVPAVGQLALPARVDRIDPTVDPQTGTIRVRLALESAVTPDNQRLRPGMFAEARVITDVREGALAIPKRAVVREAGASWVFVIGDEVVPEPVEPEGSADASAVEDENEEPSEPVVDPFEGLPRFAAERVMVELGYDDRDVVEVLSGLEEDDRVVVVGQSGLDPGATVVIPSDSQTP